MHLSPHLAAVCQHLRGHTSECSSGGNAPLCTRAPELTSYSIGPFFGSLHGIWLSDPLPPLSMLLVNAEQPA